MSDRSQSSTVAEALVVTSPNDLVEAPDQKPHNSILPVKSAPEPYRPPKRSKLRSITIVASCTGTMILNVGSSTSVSMAIPKIAEELRMPSSQVPWTISAFALSSGCMLLLFGRLADLYGRKLVWLLGAFWIIVLGLGCSFSQTGVQLIILRGLMGMGPAAMMPAALGILAHSFPPSRARSTAFATFSAGAPLGGAIGLVLGGVMAEYATWRAVFWLISGLATLVFLGGVLAMDPDVRDPSIDKRVDWVGATLVTTGLVFVTFALSDAPAVGWSSPLILSLLIIGVALIAAFLVWEHYLTTKTSFPPLMATSIWTRANGTFAAMQGVAFLAWACFNTLIFWATLYYQNYVKLDPIHTSLRFLPMPVTGVICNVVVALVVGSISGAYLLALGTTATGLSALLFAIIIPSAPYWQYGFPAAIISVIGADFIFACGTIFVAKVSLPHEQSVAGALFQTITSLGTSFGLTITTIAQFAGMDAEARRAGVTLSDTATAGEIPPEVLLKGYRAALFTSFAFGMLALAVVVVFLHGIGVVGVPKKKRVTGTEEAQPDDDSQEKQEDVKEHKSP